MSKPEDLIPIRINTLYGFEDVKPFYYLIGYDVVNINTNHIKKTSLHNGHQKYPYVTLETNSNKLNKKCLMHHLIALAYIKNAPFKVVEHLNDVGSDYRVENLLFSNQSSNIKRAFINGHGNRVEKKYKMTMKDGTEYIGTMKEISKKSNIPRQTIYCRFYKKTEGKNIKSVIEIKSTEYRKDSDRKRVSELSTD